MYEGIKLLFQITLPYYIIRTKQASKVPSYQIKASNNMVQYEDTYEYWTKVSMNEGIK